MGIKVRIPGPLRKLTNELDQVEITAANIGELINLLEKPICSKFHFSKLRRVKFFQLNKL